jgi:hypothetical protein
VAFSDQSGEKARVLARNGIMEGTLSVKNLRTSYAFCWSFSEGSSAKLRFSSFPWQYSWHNKKGSATDTSSATVRDRESFKQ